MTYYKVERHFLNNNYGVTHEDLLNMPMYEFIFKINLTEEELKEKQKQQDEERKKQEQEQHKQQKQSKGKSNFKEAKPPSTPKVNLPKNLK